MRRRSYLASTATALSAALAGCTSAGDGDSDGEHTTDSTPTPTATTDTATDETTATPNTPAVSVSITDVVLQPAALTLNVDYLTVRDDGQYLFAEVDVEEGTAEPEEFALRFAGSSYQPLADSGRRLWRSYDAGEYEPDTGGLLAFELPGSAEASDPGAVLAHPGGERELDAGMRARLAATPEFAFDVSVPDTVAADGSLAVAVAVTNEGETDARFVGGLNRYGPRVASTPVEAIRPLVPAGESRTLSVDQSGVPAETPDEDVADGETDAEFTLNTVAGNERRSVRVVEST